jgi:Rieske 2Fe-2S family protein
VQHQSLVIGSDDRGLDGHVDPEGSGGYGGPGGEFSLREWYNSESVLQLERDRLFSKSWSLVADAKELDAPGSFISPVVHGSPLLLVRGLDGVLRGFQNLCRHRGVTLAEGAGRSESPIVCPYHHWSYGLDGALDRIPQSKAQFPDVDPTCWGLLPASVDEWEGMIFASPEAGLPPVAVEMCGLAERLSPFLAGENIEVALVRYTVDCNWKLIVENHIDVYHLWYLHKQSLSPYSHPSFNWEQLGANWWSEEPLRDPSQAPHGLPWLNDGQRQVIGAHLLFPNLMLVTTGNYFATYDANPIDASHTELTLRVRACQGDDGDYLVEQIRSFLREDIAVCTRLQVASSSPAFALGPLARSHEKPVRTFHSNLRIALGHGDLPA